MNDIKSSSRSKRQESKQFESNPTGSKQTGVKENPIPYSATGGDPAELPFIDIQERYEMIEGIRYDLQPSPTFNHQKLVTGLWSRIDFTCHALGHVVVAPMDVYFDDDNIFQPDVMYISNENCHIIKPNRIEGAPDLIVEILSPSTGSKDKILKKRKYAEFGVLEYWLVDSNYRTIDQFVLEGGSFPLHGTYGVGEMLTSPRFACINVDLDQLFANLIDFE